MSNHQSSFSEDPLPFGALCLAKGMPLPSDYPDELREQAYELTKEPYYEGVRFAYGEMNQQWLRTNLRAREAFRVEKVEACSYVIAAYLHKLQNEALSAEHANYLRDCGIPYYSGIHDGYQMFHSDEEEGEV